jgi:hypothetical protein
MPKQLSPQPGGHRPVDPSDTLDQHRNRALRVLLLAAGVAVPVIAFALFLRDGASLLTLLVAAASTLVWLRGFLFQRGRVVLAVLMIAAVASTLSGGVRSAGVFVLLVSVVLASTFLSRAKTIAVAIYTI